MRFGAHHGIVVQALQGAITLHASLRPKSVFLARGHPVLRVSRYRVKGFRAQGLKGYRVLPHSIHPRFRNFATVTGVADSPNSL